MFEKLFAMLATNEMSTGHRCDLSFAVQANQTQFADLESFARGQFRVVEVQVKGLLWDLWGFMGLKLLNFGK
jgi:hypothetical protein